MFYLLCEHLGVCATQNCGATLVHHVTLGPKAPKMGKRGVGSAGHVGLHVDLTDVVALLCARQNPDNPPSHAASTLALYNELNARHPELMPLLKAGTPWYRMGEHGIDEPTSPYSVPIFSLSSKGGKVSCRYNRAWQTRPDDSAPYITSDHRHAFDIIDKVANEIKLRFEFRPGDIQFVSNLTAFHGRDKHAAAGVPGEARWLMRGWMFVPGFRSVADEALLRHGLIRHGNLGITAKELAAALAKAPHNFDAGAGKDATLDFPQPRRPDGAPIRSVPGAARHLNP